MLAAGFTDISQTLTVLTVVTFGLLLIVLGKFVWTPILAQLEEREKTIKDALDGAKKARDEAEKAGQETRAALERARVEAGELARKNQAEVAAAKAELMAAAKKESEELLVQARKTIEEEKRAAVAELRKNTVELAVLAASKLLQTHMDAGKQRALVEEFLEKLPRNGKN